MLILSNWVVNNLNNSLDTWNDKLTEIWTLITESPETFKGGTIWNVITNIYGAIQAVGLALLVLFFVIGVVKSSSSLEEIKRPEQAFKLLIRFGLARIVVVYGLDLMKAIFKIVQGVISTIMRSAGLGSIAESTLPQEIITAI